MRRRSAAGWIGSLLLHGALIGLAMTVGVAGRGGSDGVDDGGGGFAMHHATGGGGDDGEASVVVRPAGGVRPAMAPVVAGRSVADVALPAPAASGFSRAADGPPVAAAGMPTAAGGRLPGVRGNHGAGAGHPVSQVPPRLMQAPPPAYPAAARAARATGRVAVLVRVRGDGRPASTAVFRGCGRGDLDQAAVAGAMMWTFSPTPGMAAGATVPVVVNVTFSL